MKTDAEKIEKEIDELSKNEDYEAAEEKQNKLDRLLESIKKLEEVMGQRFPQVPIAVEEEKKDENIDQHRHSEKSYIFDPWCLYGPVRGLQSSLLYSFPFLGIPLSSLLFSSFMCPSSS